MFSSLKKLFDKDPYPGQGEQWWLCFWEVLAKMKRYEKALDIPGFTFGGSITMDGCSVSFSMVEVDNSSDSSNPVSSSLGPRFTVHSPGSEVQGPR